MKQEKKSRLVCGVGINDTEYKISRSERVDGKYRIVWSCPFYKRWTKMLERCYSEKWLKDNPHYIGCSVCDEWLYFSNFKAWMLEQDWKDKELDKDILVKGNREYGPNVCVFISRSINSFLIEQEKSRGEFPIGVYFDKSRGKFRATCSVVGTSKNKALGIFKTPEEAHEAWLKFKLMQAKLLASEQKDVRVAEALVKRYENFEITTSL